MSWSVCQWQNFQPNVVQHSSFWGSFLSYEEKMFLNIGPGEQSTKMASLRFLIALAIMRAYPNNDNKKFEKKVLFVQPLSTSKAYYYKYVFRYI
jgi:hypothetical protein